MHRLITSIGLTVVAGLGLVRGARGQESGTASYERGPRFLLAMATKVVPVDVTKTPVLARRLNLELEGATLKQALAEIAAQSGLVLAYSDDAVPLEKRVHLRAETITAAAALTDVLFDAGVDVVFKADGSAALVKRQAPAQNGSVAGRVTDSKTTSAIVGATVVIERTSLSATTDNDGRYRISEVAPGTYTVRARYIGYAPVALSVTVTADQETTADVALQKSVQRLDEVVTTGTVVPTEVKALPTPITVITGDELRAKNIDRLDQIFRGDVPGVLAWDQGTSEFISSINVRGGSDLLRNNVIKTYIDGIETTDANFLSSIDPKSIDHIELIRGPQASTIYGSNALNGVLQVFTKTGQFAAKPQLDVTLSGGVLQSKWVGSGATDRQDYSASLAGGGPQFSYSVGGGHAHTGEWVKEFFNTRNSVYGTVSGASGAFTAEFSGRYYQISQGQPLSPVYEPYAGPPNDLAPIDQNLQEQTSTVGFTLGYRPKRWWSHTLTVGYDRNLFQNITGPRRTNSSDTLVALYDNENSKTSVRYSTTLTVKPGRLASATLVTGVDYYRQRGLTVAYQAASITGSIPTNAFQFGVRNDFHNAGYFAQAQLGLADRLFGTAALRAEDNANFGQDYGLAWAPRFGIAYVGTTGDVSLKVRGSWGKAIRPPTQSEATGVVDESSVTLPNVTLAPESQKGWDAGAEVYYRNALSLQATYYHETAEGLIDLVLLDAAAAPPVYQYQNVGQVRNRGWEFQASVSPLLGLTLAGTYSITMSEVAVLSPTYGGDLRVGDQLVGVPRHSAGASIGYRRGRGSALLGMTYVGPWTNTDFNALFASVFGGQPFRAGRDYWITYPGFYKYRLNLNYEVRPAMSLLLTVDNLTNSYAYENFNLYPSKGRTIIAGFRFGVGR